MYVIGWAPVVMCSVSCCFPGLTASRWIFRALLLDWAQRASLVRAHLVGAYACATVQPWIPTSYCISWILMTGPKSRTGVKYKLRMTDTVGQSSISKTVSESKSTDDTRLLATIRQVNFQLPLGRPKLTVSPILLLFSEAWPNKYSQAQPTKARYARKAKAVSEDEEDEDDEFEAMGSDGEFDGDFDDEDLEDFDDDDGEVSGSGSDDEDRKPVQKRRMR
uniref:Uncharacterized protein n=1 Tax=Oryza brachyantha TaxID=4533 RepID=J3LBT7_ORYBR